MQTSDGAMQFSLTLSKSWYNQGLNLSGIGKTVPILNFNQQIPRFKKQVAHIVSQ